MHLTRCWPFFDLLPHPRLVLGPQLPCFRVLAAFWGDSSLYSQGPGQASPWYVPRSQPVPNNGVVCCCPSQPFLSLSRKAVGCFLSERVAGTRYSGTDFSELVQSFGRIVGSCASNPWLFPCLVYFSLSLIPSLPFLFYY